MWTVGLDLDDSVLAGLALHLSPDESARADRFVFARHRSRFTAGRGALRAILGGFLGVPPAALRFAYGRFGKPRLDGHEAKSGLRFNVSHSQGVGLVAVALDRELGVDVEQIHPLPDAGAIARRCFSEVENRALGSLPASEQLGGFFTCWTRKEAYVKALGDGLTRPLDGFDVTVGPREPARLLRVAGDPEETTRWSLRALAPGEGFVGAIAVEGEGWRLESSRWPTPPAAEVQVATESNPRRASPARGNGWTRPGDEPGALAARGLS